VEKLAELLAFTAIGAGLAIGLACLGSAIGQGMAAAAAAGATAEDKDLYVTELTFAILPETQAIYGFIVAMLLIAIGTGLVTF
jgi:V/A-type H+-transporting ATPase subunit K